MGGSVFGAPAAGAATSTGVFGAPTAFGGVGAGASPFGAGAFGGMGGAAGAAMATGTAAYAYQPHTLNPNEGERGVIHCIGAMEAYRKKSIEVGFG